jgi:hypothetical protein
VLAAALYRAARYEEAEAQLRGAAGERRSAADALLLALIQARRGDVPAARATLAESGAGPEKPPRDAAGASRWWQRQAEVRVLHREADSLLAGEPK